MEEGLVDGQDRRIHLVVDELIKAMQKTVPLFGDAVPFREIHDAVDVGELFEVVVVGMHQVHVVAVNKALKAMRLLMEEYAGKFAHAWVTLRFLPLVRAYPKFKDFVRVAAIGAVDGDAVFLLLRARDMEAHGVVALGACCKKLPEPVPVWLYVPVRVLGSGDSGELDVSDVNGADLHALRLAELLTDIRQVFSHPVGW